MGAVKNFPETGEAPSVIFTVVFCSSLTGNSDTSNHVF